VNDILKKRPQLIINSLNGESNAVFFSALENAGLVDLPLLSLSVAEQGMKAWGGTHFLRHYAAWSYFQSLEGKENTRFQSAYQARYGVDKLIEDPAQSAYVGMKLWVQAAREAGSAETTQVLSHILRQTLLAPEGLVAIDADSHHLWKTSRIGKVRSDGQFDIVWAAEQPLEPFPFPSYRFRDDWLALLKVAEEGKP
jgi:urea transport system substrate-binding protein